MKISTRTRYGLRTMIEIAKSGSTGGIYQKDIANNQSLSNKYLDQIISALKTAHLIHNSRGRKSGYLLSRKPSKITIYDIHNAFEPGICLLDCLERNYKCQMKERCQAFDFWKELNSLIISYFKSVTLEDLMNKKVNINDLPLADLKKK